MDNGLLSHRSDGASRKDDVEEEVTTGTSLGSHKRDLSGGILSKFPFLRTSAEDVQIKVDTSLDADELPGEPTSPKKSGRAMSVAVQQQRTRRRKGSLRKAALLGRGAQREKRDLETSPLNTNAPMAFGSESIVSPVSPEEAAHESGLGFEVSDITPRPSMDGYASRTATTALPPLTTLPSSSAEQLVMSPTSNTSPTLTYTSTTDEEDILSIPKHHLPAARVDGPLSSGSESYFSGGGGSLTRSRSLKMAKSPLSLGGLAASPLPVTDDWDYSETEWWGWVVLVVTWVVFVTGMGSCLGIWSWAWDVGETPYAPPELEDDPTLPIVGYYPALIILTCVMAWVWVVVAWVGMKYFRHAKISGD